MKLSSLYHFLNYSISAVNFKKMISIEVDDYVKQLKKKGASASVLLEEDIELRVTKKELYELCKAFENKHLDAYDIYYIADALLMAEKVTFSDELIKEKFEMLTDPEINFGELNSDVISKVLS